MNVFGDDWDDTEDWSGGGGKSKRLVEPGVSLGASVYELGPGNFNVYHFHHGGEELLIVLRGTPTVLMHDGDRVLKEGDVMPFPRGPEGGHQIRNDAESIARVLIVGGHVNPDVAEYDTGKVATIIDGDHRFHRASDEVTHAGPE